MRRLTCGSGICARRFPLLVTCPDERQQAELLARFQEEGLDCKAVLG